MENSQPDQGSRYFADSLRKTSQQILILGHTFFLKLTSGDPGVRLRLW
jgi:hypothetical protein